MSWGAIDNHASLSSCICSDGILCDVSGRACQSSFSGSCACMAERICRYDTPDDDRDDSADPGETEPRRAAVAAACASRSFQAALPRSSLPKNPNFVKAAMNCSYRCGAIVGLLDEDDDKASCICVICRRPRVSSHIARPATSLAPVSHQRPQRARSFFSANEASPRFAKR